MNGENVPLRGDLAGIEDLIDSGNITPSRTVIYKTKENVQLELHLFIPTTVTAPRAAIVFFHGGAWRMGHPQQFFWQCQYLQSRGMVAASVAYRFMPGVGIQQCIYDAKSAIRWIRTHADELKIDRDRIVASGGSAGGHLAACTAVMNLEEDGENLSVSSRPNLLLLFNPALFHDLGEDMLKIEMFKKDTPPTWMIYGTNDEMTEYGDRLLTHSQRHEYLVELHKVEGEKHGFFNHSPWRERSMNLAVEFLVKQHFLLNPVSKHS